MRFLVVGAGALGGYFGGRLLQAGRDVTFLVRPARAALLREHGLRIKSVKGDAHIPNPPTVSAQELSPAFDVIVLGCKAYDLDSAMESIAPAVGPDTAILPLLNGMKHLDRLAERFGRDHVLGGLCLISAALDADGTVRHYNDRHTLAYGEQDGASSERVRRIEAQFAEVNFTARASTQIVQEMWEKWLFIATAAGTNCLMRGAIGDIVQAGGVELTMSLLDECVAVARANGHDPRPQALESPRTLLTSPTSTVTASMLKDIERGAPTEAEHVFGDLLQRAGTALPERSLLRLVYLHLKVYEARRLREAAAAH
ncbi:2-dehydropantoate 2-reductase [Candidimonas nitroreducens]|uniref:2-dehydropantoate 2-reductase n=1 Tax=Candidimonas nitroreducens TaxID=683354 RepID=A0A225ML97_9BURK|nr:2-dehydropantoate 2-reductase [Candidimonas nitroreducens]OWT62106.1 2-dehydropantoate 2-reductase [Candidimonas nitroreducens]